jgi:hypothetical protein
MSLNGLVIFYFLKILFSDIEKLPIDIISCCEFLWCSGILDLPIIDGIYPIAFFHSVHAMSDEYYDLIFPILEEFIHHEHLILCIELIGSLIEYENRSILEHHADKNKNLLLSTREIHIHLEASRESLSFLTDTISYAEHIEISIEFTIIYLSLYSESEIVSDSESPMHRIWILAHISDELLYVSSIYTR